MSVEAEILEALASDAAVITILGSGEKIMSGNLEKRLPLAPPLLLVEALQGAPEIVGEEGIIVENWTCFVWEHRDLAMQGSGTTLESAVNKVMEKLGFARTTTRRLDGGRPEREWLEMKFSGSRMRL